jgi:hypothetical protein
MSSIIREIPHEERVPQNKTGFYIYMLISVQRKT